MPRTPGSLTLIGLAGLWGCMSQAGYLNQYEGAALATAQRRGAFELNCKDVTGEVISRKVIEPPIARGIQRAQYTIGVRGCGRQAVYWTMGVDENDCNALANSDRVQEGVGQ